MSSIKCFNEAVRLDPTLTAAFYWRGAAKSSRGEITTLQYGLQRSDPAGTGFRRILLRQSLAWQVKKEFRVLCWTSTKP